MVGPGVPPTGQAGLAQNITAISRASPFSGSALAFKCDVIPMVNLTVNVAIFGGSGMTIFNAGGMANSGE